MIGGVQREKRRKEDEEGTKESIRRKTRGEREKAYGDEAKLSGKKEEAKVKIMTTDGEEKRKGEEEERRKEKEKII